MSPREFYRAARFLGLGKVELVRRPVATLKEDEVRVRITQCGVCASSVPAWEGRPWFSYPLPSGNPGHEASGVIEAVGGAVDEWRAGDRVAYIGERGFAENEVVGAHKLLRLSPGVSDDFLAEPMACAINIFRRAGVRRGDIVALIGFGFLGRLLLPLIVHAGAKLIVITRREVSLPHDVVAMVGSDGNEIIAQVSEITGGNFCDVVIEATGQQASLDIGGEITRVRGRLVIGGYHQECRRVNMQLWNWRGLDVINAHERDPAIYLEGIRLALETVRAGIWQTSGLISHRFPLTQLAEAMHCTATRPPGFIKAVIHL